MSQDFSGTRPVNEKHAFDIARLAAWMRTHVDGFDDSEKTLAVEQFKGGQSNPTFLLQAGGRRYVLRRQPPGKLLPSAHAVDREFRVISALAASEVPVAKTYALCTDPDVIGSMFYVMDCVDGRIFWDPALPGMTPADRAAIFDEMNRVISALHTVDFASIGLGDYGKPGSFFERQIGRWTKQYRAAETEKIAAMDALIDWLPQHIPADESSAIVHGDYRLDNLIFHPSEPRIIAVLDWELSTLGHPMADFAYHCLAWQMPPGKLRGLLGHDLATLGIPQEADYVAHYCQRTGRAPVAPAEWNYYLAFNLFRLCAIAQGIATRALQGNAASAEAVEMGKLAQPVAEAGWRLANQS